MTLEQWAAQTAAVQAKGRWALNTNKRGKGHNARAQLYTLPFDSLARGSLCFQCRTSLCCCISPTVICFSSYTDVNQCHCEKSKCTLTFSTQELNTLWARTLLLPTCHVLICTPTKLVVMWLNVTFSSVHLNISAGVSFGKSRVK